MQESPGYAYINQHQPCGKSQQNNTNPHNNHHYPKNGIYRGSQQQGYIENSYGNS